jgi:hypothetical protein
LGGGFEVLNIFPISEVKTEGAGDWSVKDSRQHLDSVG